MSLRRWSGGADVPQTQSTARRQPVWDNDEELFAEPPSVSQGHAGQRAYVAPVGLRLDTDPAAGPNPGPKSDRVAHHAPITAAAAPGLAAEPPRRERRPRAKRGADQGTARRSQPAWLWAIAGFIVGIVFWHVIGFWDFVSQTILPPGAKRGGSGAASTTSGDNEGQHVGQSFFPARVARPRISKSSSTAAGEKAREAWAVTVTEEAIVSPEAPDTGR